MKSTVFIICLLLSSLLLGQENKDSMQPTEIQPFREDEQHENIVTRATAIRGPVFGSCRKYVDDKHELYRCFNEEIQAAFYKELVKFDWYTEEQILFLIKFVINQEGDIFLESVDSNGVQSDDLRKIVTKSFENLSNNINKKGTILPALDMNNKPASLSYVIPIRFLPEK